jgi:myosin protein heavy chain
MYKKLYEKNSTIVNRIINETKECLKNLYKPLKNLRDDIKKYSNNFKNSIDQLSVPLKNEKKGLNDIKYENYPKEIQNQFLKDKEEVFKEIDNFLEEANEFYKDYGALNKAISEDINNFVDRFMRLAEPAKELTTFMRKFMKIFEKSARSFNDFSNKKKIDETLQKIKEPINEFQNKNKSIENLLNSIRNIKKERINEAIETSNKIKDKINKLEICSRKISEKIKKIRDKYGEPEEKLKEIKINPVKVINTEKALTELEKERDKIEKSATVIVEEISKNNDNARNQTRLDLLFIMDITNSMDYYLDQVKKYILDIISTIQINCAGSEIYLGFIGYKDFIDLDFGEQYINLEFTTNYESISKNIEYLVADGGGDTPEDLCGALELAKNKEWSGNTKFAILVTDSPCHGEQYHNLTGDQKDNYPEGDREGRNIEEFIEYFAKNDISLFCLKINSTTDIMFNKFSEVYNKNKKENSRNKFVLEDGKKLHDIVTKNAIDMFQHRDVLSIFKN